jgi:hypothetical protein
VGRHHHTLAEIRQDRAGIAVELEDRIDRVGFAIYRAAARAAGGRGAAAFVRPDIAVDRIDIDAGGRAPRSSGGQLAPVAVDLRRRIRQALACNWIAHGSGYRRTRRRVGLLARPAGAARRQEERRTGTDNKLCDS